MSCRFIFDGALDRLDRVHILHFSSDTELIASLGANREVDVAAHRSVRHLALGDLGIPEQGLQTLEVGFNLLGTRQIGLADDLDEGNARTVEIDVRGILTDIVDELSCVLFHMDLLDSDLLFAL